MGTSSLAGPHRGFWGCALSRQVVLGTADRNSPLSTLNYNTIRAILEHVCPSEVYQWTAASISFTLLLDRATATATLLQVQDTAYSSSDVPHFKMRRYTLTQGMYTPGRHELAFAWAQQIERKTGVEDLQLDRVYAIGTGEHDYGTHAFQTAFEESTSGLPQSLCLSEAQRVQLEPSGDDEASRLVSAGSVLELIGTPCVKVDEMPIYAH